MRRRDPYLNLLHRLKVDTFYRPVGEALQFPLRYQRDTGGQRNTRAVKRLGGAYFIERPGYGRRHRN